MPFGIIGKDALELLPVLALRLLYKIQYVLLIQGGFTVVALWRTKLPALSQHVLNNIVLENAFAGGIHVYDSPSASKRCLARSIARCKRCSRISLGGKTVIYSAT